MKEPNIGEAILALDSQSIFIIRDELITWIENPSSLDDKKIKAKLAEMKLEYELKAYARARKLEYPSINDVVVALAEKAEGNDKMWKEITSKRAKVKINHPKP